ncbi:MAG TPA: hypothetical protein VFJ97_15070 [Dermatophilaceae bacterium]|nr:hypothetical protein [Dermatophilaceae bacterium]
MLVEAVVVPGAPALVPELMGAAAGELSQLRGAAIRALSQLTGRLLVTRREGPVRLVVLGPGRDGSHDPRGEVSFVQFGKDVRVPPLARDVPPASVNLPTSVMVVRYLVSRVGRAPDRPTGEAFDGAHVQGLWAGAEWLTGGPVRAAEVGRELRVDPRPVGLVLVADGATSHGPKAPRAEDSRAGPSDAAIWSALASGEPAALRDADLALSAHLGATGPAMWPALIAACAGRRFHAELLWQGAPYGVGWAVASWHRRPVG